MGLSNSQFNAIMREYENLQSGNRADLMRRREEVFRKVPELKALEKQPGISAMARFRRAAIEKDERAAEGFSEELKALSDEKARLLREAGFPPDMLEMRYHCPRCRDTGFTDGKKCSCFTARAVRMLYAQSNIDRVLQKENFDVFSLDWYDDERVIPALGVTERAWMEQVLFLCRQFVAEFPKKHGSLLFQGNTGVGKTFLSNCIARDLIEAGQSVIYLTAGELFDCMASVRMEKTEDLSVQELYEWLFRCDLLILDDLGTEMTNSFTASQLFFLLNARLTGGLGTVISTNLSLRMLRDTYTERVTSRLTSGFETVVLYGDDIRKKKRIKEYSDGK